MASDGSWMILTSMLRLEESDDMILEETERARSEAKRLVMYNMYRKVEVKIDTFDSCVYLVVEWRGWV